ncbi:SRPBCC family protein [Streptomyces sp. NPDC101213]|uniref:SRPBCC family protein n=1 Tax=Streptomyces sp. NPDC101213 TaxID=3366130 RepID=UPI0038199E93
MGRLTLRATGPAGPETVWQRYACVDRWPAWSPQIKAVHTPDRQLTSGMSGTVESAVGVRLAFAVEHVDHDRRAWTWRVGLGPIRLRLHHDVRTHGRGSTTGLTMEGPRPVLLAYAPLARLALRRLVRP